MLDTSLHDSSNPTTNLTRVSPAGGWIAKQFCGHPPLSDSSEHQDEDAIYSTTTTTTTDSKTQQRRPLEWLNRLSSLGHSTPVESSQIISSDSRTPTNRSAHVQPPKRGYLTALRVCINPQSSDDNTTPSESGDEVHVFSSTSSGVILTSSDFLDFVLSHPGNRMNKITVKTVLERTQSSGDLDHNSRRRRSSRYEEFQLIQCPSAALQMPPIILIPGGGIFYFWKAGFTMYLSKHFDLSRCIFMGTSAGALASAVTCCSDSISRASRLAIKMAMQLQVWEKPHFLAGVLHNLTGQWLERVIPKDVDVEALKHRLLIIAYRVSRVRLEGLCRFSSRQDLIECLLASIHIPFYANGRAATKARGISYLDGSFGPDLIKTFAEGIPSKGIILIRCSESDYKTPVGRRQCIRKLPPNDMFDLVHSGFAYAEKLHCEKKLEALMRYETHPPGSFSSVNDPYLDFTRLGDDTLDL